MYLGQFLKLSLSQNFFFSSSFGLQLRRGSGAASQFRARVTLDSSCERSDGEENVGGHKKVAKVALLASILNILLAHLG